MLTIVPAAELKTLVARIFKTAGAPPLHADIVAESLVEANLVGHDSHGVIRVKEYVDAIRKGTINPSAEPRIAHETPTTLSVDGRNGFGAVVAGWTMGHLVDKALVSGVAAAGIFRCSHVGRLGVYVQSATERGCIALAFVNGGSNEPRVAPFGGRRPVFGTNPLAASVPMAEDGPVVIDFSTAAAAAGKIRVARDKGELLPEGWILDREGRPSRRPRDYYDGGMLLPAAGHKGFALALLVEALAGVLSGAGSQCLNAGDGATTNGVFFLVLDVSRFQPLDRFCADMAALGARVKAVPPAAEGVPVCLPGEPERSTRTARLRSGIEVPEATWRGLVETAAQVGVKIAPEFKQL